MYILIGGDVHLTNLDVITSDCLKKPYCGDKDDDNDDNDIGKMMMYVGQGAICTAVSSCSHSFPVDPDQDKVEENKTIRH